MRRMTSKAHGERNIALSFFISARDVIARIFQCIERALVAKRRCFILFQIPAFFQIYAQPIYMDASRRLHGIIPDTRRAFVVIYLWHHAQYV
jgi:hypothetical protein